MYSGHLDVLEHIFQIFPNFTMENVELELENASYSGNLDTVKYLVDRFGPKLTEGPICCAARGGKLHVLKYWLDLPKYRSLHDLKPSGPLMKHVFSTACELGHSTEQVKFLIDYGMDIFADNGQVSRDVVYYGYYMNWLLPFLQDLCVMQAKRLAFSRRSLGA